MCRHLPQVGETGASEGQSGRVEGGAGVTKLLSVCFVSGVVEANVGLGWWLFILRVQAKCVKRK